MAMLGLRVVRTFEVLTPRGWRPTTINNVAPGDTFRVLDDGAAVLLAPELKNDPGVYFAAQVQAEGLHFPVRLPTGKVIDRVVSRNP